MSFTHVIYDRTIVQMASKYLVCFCLNLLLAVTVFGITISSSPTIPVMGYPSGTMVIRCDSSGVSDTVTDITISRKRKSDTDFITAVLISDRTGTSNPVNEAYFHSNSDLAGRVGVTTTGTLQADTSLLSSLELRIVQANLTCTDEAEYKCKLVSRDTDNDVTSVETSVNVTFYVPPSVPTLQVSVQGSTGGTGTLDDPAEADVNQVVTLTCSATIGSDDTRTFSWDKTMLTGTSNEVNQNFNPANPDSQLTGLSNCVYGRTVVGTYNISTEDGTRQNFLAFRCSVSSLPPQGTGISSEMSSSTIYYINVAGSNTGGGNTGNTGGVATAGSGNAGLIAGVVVGVIAALVIVVLLVYFLWYRRRGGAGETYRTKEEHGSSNPNLTDNNMYATVDKSAKTKGHENKAMDEPHESRGKYRDADDYGRGRRNYALDDEDYNSRDGSPTFHISGAIGTGV